MRGVNKFSWVALLAATMLLAACDTEKVELLKSPCAGLEGSPCGPKRNVNGWWLPQETAAGDHA